MAQDQIRWTINCLTIASTRTVESRAEAQLSTAGHAGRVRRKDIGDYKWNRWQIAAIMCWIVGGAMGIVPCITMYVMYQSGDVFNSKIITGVLLAALVMSGTEGTLHQIGSSREKREL